MNDYGFLSIVPPLLTIAVALYSRNVLFALITGILSGSLIIADFNPFYAILDAMENQVLKEVTTGSQVQVILIIFVIGGFVKLLAMKHSLRSLFPMEIIFRFASSAFNHV